MARNPLTAVPATRSSLPLLKIRRRLIVGFLVLSCLLGLISTAAWLAADKTPPAPVVLPDQSAVSLAQTVVEDFLAARKSAVPAVRDVNNNFAAVSGLSGAAPQALAVTELTYAGSKPWKLGDGTNPTTDVEQETFNALIGGQLYEVTVPMVKSGKLWLLGAAPSITPARLAANQTEGGINYDQLYPSTGGGNDSVLPNPDYRTQIARWATTFARAGQANGDLLALTGDEVAGHTYSGLGGWTVVGDPTIGSVVPVTSPFPGFIVRVSLVLRSPAANGPTLSTDYDLYLRSDKNPTQPPVVAWGAAGSYRSLQPYFNADQR